MYNLLLVYCYKSVKNNLGVLIQYSIAGDHASIFKYCTITSVYDYNSGYSAIYIITIVLNERLYTVQPAGQKHVISVVKSISRLLWLYYGQTICFFY
jgi:hypothetical protein